MDARNVPSQSIKIAVTEKPLKIAVDAASDDIVQHANSFRDADARARALRAIYSARELAIKNTMKTILPSTMSWMGEMGIENQPIGWKSDVGQHGKFTLRLCEKTASIHLGQAHLKHGVHRLRAASLDGYLLSLVRPTQTSRTGE